MLLSKRVLDFRQSTLFYFFLCLLLIVLLLFSTSVTATGITISPLRVELDENAVGTVKLTNTSRSVRVVTISAYSWDQEQFSGAQILLPTRDLIVSPPVLRLNPGQTKLMRIGLRRAPDTIKQLNYRFIADANIEKQNDAENLEVAFNYRLNVPVYVAPKQGDDDTYGSGVRFVLNRSTRELDVVNDSKLAFTYNLIGVKRIANQADYVWTESSHTVLSGKVKRYKVSSKELSDIISAINNGESLLAVGPDLAFQSFSIQIK